MPLLFADLDNTLVDRAAAYRAWAEDYLDRRGADPALIDAMVAADGDGLRPKPEVAADITELLDLSDAESAALIRLLRAGVVQRLRLEDDVVHALVRARGAGWAPVIVTNGTEAQQSAKIATLGLEQYVDGYVISEAVGVSKPDPEIFAAAAAAAGFDAYDDAWMVGDTASADILGAQNAGLSSVWLRRGREWDDSQPPPTHVADSFPHAVDLIID